MGCKCLSTALKVLLRRLMCITDSLCEQLHSVCHCDVAHTRLFSGESGMPVLATIQQSKLGIQQRYGCQTRAMTVSQLRNL